MGRHDAAFLILWTVAAAVIVMFVRQDGLATVSDDSVAYLTMAHGIAGTAPPALAPWVASQSHFPPLFPALLALFGAAGNIARAHLVVGAVAIAALPIVYLYLV